MHTDNAGRRYRTRVASMSLWAPHLLLASRWVVPTIALTGSTPAYLTALAAVRLLTLPLPAAYYWRGEQAVYSTYQAMVGFFFETWSGVEVWGTHYLPRRIATGINSK